MARSRNIKPAFFMNDELAEIAPLGRLLFIGLWTIADREGRLEDRPLRIKAEILPYDDCDVDKLLDHLHEKGFIFRYCHSSTRQAPDKHRTSREITRLIQVTNFTKHQNPHIKEKASELPAPEVTGASTMQAPEKHHTDPADSLNLIPDSLNLIPDSASGARGDRETKKTDDDFNSRMIKHFAQTFGYPPNHTQIEMLLSFAGEGMPDELIIEALKRSAEAGAGNPKYTTAILQSWLSKKAFTLDDVKVLDNLRRPKKRDGPADETAAERLLRQEIEREQAQKDVIDIT